MKQVNVKRSPIWIRLGTITCFVYLSLPWQAFQARYWSIMMIFLIGFFLVLLLDRDRPKPLMERADWPCWFFVVCLAAGVVFPIDRSMALRRYGELALTVLIGYYLGKDLLQTARDRLFVITMLCALSGAVALYGLGYFLTHQDSPLFTANVLHYGAFSQEYSRHFHPTILGNYVSLSSFFAWYLLRQGSGKIKMLGIGTLLLGCACLLAPLWRGALPVVIVMGCGYLLLEQRYAAASVVILIVMAVLLLSPLFPAFSQNVNLESMLFHPTGIFSRYRVSRMKTAWLMFKDAPLCGVGFDQYRTLFDRYYPLKRALPNIPFDVKIADNMYWTLLAETGLAGFVGFWLFALTLLRRGLQAIRGSEQAERRHYLMVTMAVFVGILVSMSGYELLYWRTPCLLFSLVCGFLSIHFTPRNVCNGKSPAHMMDAGR